MTSASYIAARAQEYMSKPRLTAEEESELAHRFRDHGDLGARQKLVEANMRYVVSIARKFRRYPVDLGDLISEGSLGLVIAIERFDPEKGVRLVTYASYWIRAFIFQSIIRDWKKGKTGLGMTRSKTFFRIRRILASQRARYGDEPNFEQMSGDLDVSMDCLREMLEHLEMRDLSLDAEADGEKRGLHERVSDEAPGPEILAQRVESTQITREIIRRALDVLDERERLVANARLMRDDPRTLADLGRRMGVSRERARQIEVRARQKLSRALRREGLSRTGLGALLA